MAGLLGTTSVGWAGPTQYLKLPFMGGGATTWSGSISALGSGPGDTVATASNADEAATFSSAALTYALATDAYFDVSGLEPGTYTIGSPVAAIDLNGNTFTANAGTGQTVTFGATLGNSQVGVGGGLAVSGGGAVRFDNSNGQYVSGMDIGALSIDGATVTLPAAVSFGFSGNGSNSYSSISLANASTLVLGDGAAIGSSDSSVAISSDTGTIKLAMGGAIASTTPNFAGASDSLSIDTNGGTFNVYGNEAGGTVGSAITLTVNDTPGTGTLNLYGDQTGSAGGDDYANANVTIASGTLNLLLDGTYNQSLGNLVMIGGAITGSATTGDVTMSGSSQMAATTMQMNSLTMSGSAKFTGLVTIYNDLDLTDAAVFSPAAAGSPTYVGGNLNANAGSPHYVASFDGTNVSEITLSGSADAPNLQVDLRLAPGPYLTGVYNLTIIAAGALNAPLNVAPKWNIAGVYLDSANTIPATGDEITLSLTQSGTDLNLGLTINRALYVGTSATPDYIAPFVLTTITWSTPAAITYGTALSGTQLNAGASVAGALVYSPTAGTILGAGSQTLNVTFTPTDAVDDTSATGSMTLTVNKATPTVTWATPTSIIAGTALGSAQLNATASVSGTFVYSPAGGTVLSAGSPTLAVTFMPTDAADYTAASGSVNLNVTRPSVAAAIVLGSLNQTYTGSPGAATASTSPAGLAVAITYNGSLTAPTVAGIYALVANVTTPGYAGSTGGTLTIAKVIPIVSWAAPAAIRAGTPLAAAQLNASVGGGIPGTFAYSPAADALLSAGVHTLNVTFKPTDLLDFTTVTSSVPLTVVPPGPTAYFGSIGSGTGGSAAHGPGRNADANSGATFAASVNTAQTGGTMAGFISSLNEGFAANFTLTASGAFSVITPALMAGGNGPNLTFAGQVAGGVLSGTITPGGLTFSAALDPATGSSATLTGAYSAAAVGSTGVSTYSIVGTQSDAFVLAITPSLVIAGAGTVSAAGTIVVQTTQSVTITEVVNSGSATISGTLGLASGATLPVAGLASTTAPTNRLANLSTRGQVTSGQNILVSGFVIGGSTPETLLLRAVGPGLAGFGVAGTLASPNLQVVNSSGAIVATNAGWGGGSTLTTIFAQVGAFALSPTSADSAVMATLPPGAYSLQVTNGGSGSGGVALAEIYEVSPSVTTTRLVNISSRGLVSAGNAALVGGFYVGGNTPEKVLIRGIGPTLAQFGITGALAAPVLSVYDGNGNLVAQNQTWGTPIAVNASQVAAAPAAITTADSASGAFALPAGSSDSALIVTLAPGAYAAQLTGANGATGVGLIEVYETP